MTRSGNPGIKREDRVEDSSAVHSTERFSPIIEELLQRWAGLLRTAARRYGLAPADEIELEQEFRIRLWRTLERGREKPKDIGSSYVYRVVMSAAVDLLRRHRAERAASRLSLDDVGDQIPAPQVHDTDEAELTAALENALSTLALDRRVVVRMHLDGKHRDEISNLLGWSGARTRNLLYRGLADLKRALEISKSGGVGP
jgi:RNA polymerase sigma factor (sigma-70 family)